MRIPKTIRGRRKVNLSNHRVRMGLSQEEYATMMGTTRDIYQNSEIARGSSNMGFILKMAELEMLFAQSPPPIPPAEYDEEKVYAECESWKRRRRAKIHSALPFLKEGLAKAEVMYSASLNMLAHIAEQQARPTTTFLRSPYIELSKRRLHQRLKKFGPMAQLKLRIEIAVIEGELKALEVLG